MVYAGGKIDVNSIRGKIDFKDTNFNVSGTLDIGDGTINFKDCITDNLYDYINKISSYNIPFCSEYLWIASKSATINKTILKYFSINTSFYTHDDAYFNEETMSEEINASRAIKFNDTLFNVSGMIVQSAPDLCSFTYCKSKKYSLAEYIRKICEFVEKYDKATGIVKLYEYVRGGELYTFYDNQHHSLKHLEKIFIKSFFHPQAESLWNMVKTIHYDSKVIWNAGQPPRLNLLLHGPPGTGKSSIAYRFAMLLQRHIINVKLSSSSMTKTALNKVFRTPFINNTIMKPNEVIFVLDEFDQDIKSLLLRQSHKEQQIEKVKHIVDTLLENELIPQKDKIRLRKKKLKEKVRDEKKEEHKDEKKEEHKDEKKEEHKDEKKEPRNRGTRNKEEDEEEDIVSTESGLDKMDKIVAKTEAMYKKMTDSYNDIVTLDDLLTIFQGSVPIEGSIIIAMTNHYEELVEKCPKLFRAGRMTPIYFGNFDTTTLNKISRYYFKQHMTFTSETISIQPSKVMEVLVEAKVQKKQKFKFFCEQLHKIVPEIVVPSHIIERRNTEKYIDFSSYCKTKVCVPTSSLISSTPDTTPEDKIKAKDKYKKMDTSEVIKEMNSTTDKTLKYNLAELLHYRLEYTEALYKQVNRVLCSHTDLPHCFYYMFMGYNEGVYQGKLLEKKDKDELIQLGLFALKMLSENSEPKDRWAFHSYVDMIKELQKELSLTYAILFRYNEESKIRGENWKEMIKDVESPLP
jgi:ATPases of the AAA+ class